MHMYSYFRWNSVELIKFCSFYGDHSLIVPAPTVRSSLNLRQPTALFYTASVFICFCLLSFFLSIYLCLSFTAVSPLDLLLIFIADRPHASSDNEQNHVQNQIETFLNFPISNAYRTNSLCFGKADESMALENRKRFVVHISYEQWSLTLFLCSVYVKFSICRLSRIV